MPRRSGPDMMLGWVLLIFIGIFLGVMGGYTLIRVSNYLNDYTVSN